MAKESNIEVKIFVTLILNHGFWVRLAHPGGPLATNKAVALAKFLERKLQQPDGLASIDPHLLELAVKNAKDTVNASNFWSPYSFCFSAAFIVT